MFNQNGRGLSYNGFITHCITLYPAYDLFNTNMVQQYANMLVMAGYTPHAVQEAKERVFNGILKDIIEAANSNFHTYMANVDTIVDTTYLLENYLILPGNNNEIPNIQIVNISKEEIKKLAMHIWLKLHEFNLLEEYATYIYKYADRNGLYFDMYYSDHLRRDLAGIYD